jgi:predicted enzyme related to lactoylglutathione lyase
MSLVTSFPQGTPIWVDLQSTDPVAASAFYAGLFGWDIPPGSPEMGGYALATLNGVPVTSIGPQPPMMDGAPSTWMSYLAVDDVDAATGAVTAAGGTVLLSPGEVGNGARMSIVADPVGAVAGLWQQGSPTQGVRDEPGALSWIELLADNFESALPFYETVLGMGASQMVAGDAGYMLLNVGDHTVAGAGSLEARGVPSHWRVYFEVADIEVTRSRASELGGSLLGETDSAEGVGSWAVVSDPQGGVFALMQSAPMAG